MAGAPPQNKSPKKASKVSYPQKPQQVDLGASSNTAAQTNYFGSPDPKKTRLESSMTSNMFRSP